MCIYVLAAARVSPVAPFCKLSDEETIGVLKFDEETIGVLKFDEETIGVLKFDNGKLVDVLLLFCK